MRKVHLMKVQDVRRLLSRIINQVLDGKLEPTKANCAINGCNVILRAMEKGDIERRLEELERIYLENKDRRYINGSA
ncbi:MAG TPA: hypothetical protein VHT73_13525 [Thermodesulfobacteriota bacterium]|nr:hypothetical protein [Thermodesulfobacteriota bacterium]